MLNITVYGPGCAKCKETEKRVREVLAQSGVDAEVKHASDFADMARAGILVTPAVAIDGTIKLAGRIPTVEEIRGWLLSASAAGV